MYQSDLSLDEPSSSLTTVYGAKLLEEEEDFNDVISVGPYGRCLLEDEEEEGSSSSNPYSNSLMDSEPSNPNPYSNSLMNSDSGSYENEDSESSKSRYGSSLNLEDDQVNSNPYSNALISDHSPPQQKQQQQDAGARYGSNLNLENEMGTQNPYGNTLLQGTQNEGNNNHDGRYISLLPNPDDPNSLQQPPGEEEHDQNDVDWHKNTETVLKRIRKEGKTNYFDKKPATAAATTTTTTTTIDATATIWYRLYNFILRPEFSDNPVISHLFYAILYNRFIVEATAIATELIRQKFYSGTGDANPKAKKYQPFATSGVAGGDKYLVDGIFFKFPSNSMGLYPSLIASMKASTHELRGINCILEWKNELLEDLEALQANHQQQQQSIGLVDANTYKHFCVPLFAVIDFMGFRMSAICYLPLKDADEKMAGTWAHVHNPKNNTLTVIQPMVKDVVHRLMYDLGLGSHTLYHLNLAKLPKGPVEVKNPNDVVEMEGPCDFEVHKLVEEENELYFFLDAHRLFPPETPKGYLHRLLHPNLVKFVYGKEKSTIKLNSDAFDHRSRGDGAVDALKTTLILRNEVIPSFVDKFYVGKGFNNQAELVNVVHSQGINLRYLGFLRYQYVKKLQAEPGAEKSKIEGWREAAKLILLEMISRSMNEWIRYQLRRLSQSESIGGEKQILTIVATFLWRFITGLGNNNPSNYPSAGNLTLGLEINEFCKALVIAHFDEWIIRDVVKVKADGVPLSTGGLTISPDCCVALTATERSNRFNIAQSLPQGYKDKFIQRMNEIGGINVKITNNEREFIASAKWEVNVKSMNKIIQSKNFARKTRQYLKSLQDTFKLSEEEPDISKSPNQSKQLSEEERRNMKEKEAIKYLLDELKSSLENEVSRFLGVDETEAEPANNIRASGPGKPGIGLLAKMQNAMNNSVAKSKTIVTQKKSTLKLSELDHLNIASLYDISQYDQKFSRAQIQERLNFLLYNPNNQQHPLVKLNTASLDIYPSCDAHTPEYQLSLAPEDVPAAQQLTEEDERIAAEAEAQKKKRQKNNKRPLEGIKVAIDPCMVGGSFSKFEVQSLYPAGSPITSNSTSTVAVTGEQNLLVAQLLKSKLEEMGAQIMLTRNDDQGVLLTPLLRYIESHMTLQQIVELVLIKTSFMAIPSSSLLNSWLNVLRSFIKGTEAEKKEGVFKVLVSSVLMSLENRFRSKNVKEFHPDLFISIFLGTIRPLQKVQADSGKILGEYVMFLPGAFSGMWELAFQEMRYNFVRHITTRIPESSYAFDLLLQKHFNLRSDYLHSVKNFDTKNPQLPLPMNTNLNIRTDTDKLGIQMIRGSGKTFDTYPMYHRNIGMTRISEAQAVCYSMALETQSS